MPEKGLSPALHRTFTGLTVVGAADRPGEHSGPGHAGAFIAGSYGNRCHLVVGGAFPEAVRKESERWTGGANLNFFVSLPEVPGCAADELADGNDFDGSTMPVDGVSSVIEGAIANELLRINMNSRKFLFLDHLCQALDEINFSCCTSLGCCPVDVTSLMAAPSLPEFRNCLI